MLSAALLLLCNSLFLSLHLTGSAGSFPKPLSAARVEGKTLLRRALEAVPASCFARVAVVTQYPQGMELAREMGFLPVENSRPDLGLSHTVALGMAHMQDMDAVLFQVSDQPLLRRVHTGRHGPESCSHGGAHRLRHGRPARSGI